MHSGLNPESDVLTVKLVFLAVLTVKLVFLAVLTVLTVLDMD